MSKFLLIGEITPYPPVAKILLTLTIHELCHWTSIAGMFLQSHCGDEEDGHIGLSSWLHYILCSFLVVCHETICFN